MINMGCGLAWLDSRCPSKPLYNSPFSTREGIKKKATKASWVEVRTRRDHSPITIMHKTDLTWRNGFNSLPIKSQKDNEK